MSGKHLITSSLFIQSGSIAQFKSGINVSGSITGSFVGSGAGLTNLTTTGAQLFVGSASDHVPPTFGNWFKDGGGSHAITLQVSSSGIQFNHFTFLRSDTDNPNWREVSDYSGEANGLASSGILNENLDTGIYRYLLLAASTASNVTVVAETIAIINPEEL